MYQQPQPEHSYSRERMRREMIEKSFESKKREKVKHPLSVIIIILIIAILASGAILVRMWLETDPFFTPGEIIIDDSVSDTYKDIINKNVEKWNNNGNKIRRDIKFTEKTTYTMEGAADNDVLVKIELPTVDFYSKELNVTAEQAEGEDVTFVDYNEITPENRVVSIDNKYFFDDIKNGAKYTYITYTTDEAEKNTAIWLITADSQNINLPDSANEFLSFAQTGVTALTRAMTITLNGAANGRGSYFADNIKDFLSSKDLTHISNEVSFADNCKGSRNTMSLCADWRTLDTITAIGVDIVELTGNHNNNYGYDANVKTIKKYQELGMKTFGGGVNEEEASKPLELESKGNHITLLGYNHSTSTKGNGELANGNKAGANEYTAEKAKADINAAKARGDLIIVDIQFAECYSYPDEGQEMPACDAPIAGQKAFFRQFIDWGADIVVGTQAHQPQTFEYYQGKPIYYGLGNLFFDQTYWPGTQRGYILTHYIKDSKILNTRISPTWYDTKHQVYLTNEETSEKFIKRLVNSSPEGK